MTRPAPSRFAAVDRDQTGDAGGAENQHRLARPHPPAPGQPEPRRKSGIAERRRDVVGDTIRDREGKPRIDQRAFGHRAEWSDRRSEIEVDAPAIAPPRDTLPAEHERTIRHRDVVNAPGDDLVEPGQSGGQNLNDNRVVNRLRFCKTTVDGPLIVFHHRGLHGFPCAGPCGGRNGDAGVSATSD